MDTCSACGGTFHPATGHRHSEKVVLCGVCARDFMEWIKDRENSMAARKKDKLTGKKQSESWSDCAIKSIIGTS